MTEDGLFYFSDRSCMAQRMLNLPADQYTQHGKSDSAFQRHWSCVKVSLIRTHNMLWYLQLLFDSVPSIWRLEVTDRWAIQMWISRNQMSWAQWLVMPSCSMSEPSCSAGRKASNQLEAVQYSRSNSQHSDQLMWFDVMDKNIWPFTNLCSFMHAYGRCSAWHDDMSWCHVMLADIHHSKESINSSMLPNLL